MTLKNKRLVLGVLGVWLCCAGCMDTLGSIVPADRRIPLIPGDPQTGSFKAFEFVLNYTYRLTRQNGQLPGKLRIDGSIGLNAGALDSLSIWVHLLDGSGKVLSFQNIYAVGYKSGGMSREVSAELEAPPETAAMSFFYTAQMQRGGYR